jgi:hypothetical protein
MVIPPVISVQEPAKVVEPTKIEEKAPSIIETKIKQDVPLIKETPNVHPISNEFSNPIPTMIM